MPNDSANRQTNNALIRSKEVKKNEKLYFSVGTGSHGSGERNSAGRWRTGYYCAHVRHDDTRNAGERNSGGACRRVGCAENRKNHEQKLNVKKSALLFLRGLVAILALLISTENQKIELVREQAEKISPINVNLNEQIRRVTPLNIISTVSRTEFKK